jgi:ClpP class serine protease
VEPGQEARLREVMADVHGAFKDAVRAARGTRLSGADERELFSSRAWAGRRALDLGLVNGLGEMRAAMRQRFGARTRFVSSAASLVGQSKQKTSWKPTNQPLITDHYPKRNSQLLCSDPEVGGLRGLLGGAASGALLGGGGAVAYEAACGAAEAALDAADAHALWARHRVL